MDLSRLSIKYVLIAMFLHISFVIVIYEGFGFNNIDLEDIKKLLILLGILTIIPYISVKIYDISNISRIIIKIVYVIMLFFVCFSVYNNYLGSFSEVKNTIAKGIMTISLTASYAIIESFFRKNKE